MDETLRSHEVTSDHLHPQCYSTFTEWQTDHPSISPFLSLISPAHPTSSKSPFAIRRRQIHQRTIIDLNQFKHSLNKLGETLQSQNSKFASTLPNLSFPYFNLTARKALFLRSLILQKRDEVISKKIWIIMNRYNEVESILELLSSDLIPIDRYCCVSTSFLTIHFDIDEAILAIQRLTVKLRQLREEILPVVPIPTFNEYFRETILSIESGDSVLMGTIDRGLNWMIEKHFEKELRHIRNESVESIGDGLFAICKKIMAGQTGLTKSQLAVGTSITFRVVYEIIGIERERGSEETEAEKLNELRKLPVSAFGIPGCLRREIPIAEFFNGSQYCDAVNFLTISNWCTNPFDRLTNVVRALAEIGAKLRGDDKSIQVIAFDDQFPIFLPAVLVSGMSDIGGIVKEARQTLKKFHLSSEFQYALRTLNAVQLFVERGELVNGQLIVRSFPPPIDDL